MKATQKELTLTQRLCQSFLTGLLGFLPLVLTLAVLAWLVVFLHDLVGPKSEFGKILSSAGFNFVACETVAYLVGLIGTFALVYGFGLLIESGKARSYQGLFENAMNRVPLVGSVYDASKQLTSMFDRNNEDVKGMQPVFCSFGGEGGTVLLALLPSPKTVRIGDRDYHIVIVPTAPVPFGGALICVPIDCVEPAGCSLEGMVNVFMTMGVSAPSCLGAGTQEKPPIDDAVPKQDSH
ncbi:DUF502 domain-containing protein [Bythopirellula goksoeyrii]|uniref:DUF502 domain-containing protein n=1 Tax=Bythopirellula goksoeyrii TaxID=1400387 RepID=A0A5B9Q8X6_9BACT|nr:DUF502 domain-containing protein [Bythopirellula goksoeyrii]QEG35437.1 hypothetical protein Pr1d_27360 [Bythopirellula goksoeyrii]